MGDHAAGTEDQEHSGLLVAALVAAAAAELALAVAVAVAVGLPPARALAAAVLVTLGVSTVAALGLGACVGLQRSVPGPEPAVTLPEPSTPARRNALALVDAVSARLLRAVEVSAHEVDLMSCAIELQVARLQLARVLLTEDGELPPDLEHELLVAHRGTSDWLRTPRLS